MLINMVKTLLITSYDSTVIVFYEGDNMGKISIDLSPPLAKLHILYKEDQILLCGLFI